MDKENPLSREIMHVMHRIHQSKSKMKGNGDLANVEFFMLIGLSAMLDAKYKTGCEEINKMFVDIEEEDVEDIRGVTLGEIIKVSDMTMSAASKKITIFEKKGYIKRETSKKDRRKVYITLTQKGEEICQREKEQKAFLMKELIHRMGEEDMERLLELSNKVFDIIEDIDKEQKEKE